MYAVISRATSLVLGVGVCAACGGERPRDELMPDAQGAADAPAINPLDGFSPSSKERFHLIVSGTVADGRPRVYYASKVMYLEARGTTPNLTASILTNPTSGERRYSMAGSFAWGIAGSAAPTVQLQNEATAAHVAVVRADLGLPHVACGTAGTLLTPTFATRCDAQPAVSGFGLIAWQATQPGSVTFDAARAAVDSHLADGSAWNDLLAGDIAWHVPGGEVLHTKLEISCIGQLFEANGDPAVKLFSSPACTARYAP